MTRPQAFAPNEETLRYGAERLPERRWTPGAVGCLEGPGALGPESVGALSLVSSTFTDGDKAQRAYRRFTDAQCALREAPGFLRWFSFVDGVHGYGLGWWRSSADVAAFARSQLHRELIQEQRSEGLEYSQFAGVWSNSALGRRSFSCPECLAVTAAPARHCSGCGGRLDDGYAPEAGDTPRVT